ncbi:CCA tRNA nucleotidyltransferase [archaeon SCG-AAA382B04]|nr:CCA tRNA nucleotidyltransferase [archaeon SCG-AAA382B04]
MEEVLEEIIPSEQEKRELEQTTEFVKNRVNEIAKDYEISVEPRLVGSSSRGTWISGDRDIDVFILLPKTLEEEEFRQKGLKIAREVAQEADTYQEDYAEHPYITARFGSFLVDLVPAYDVEDASEVTSAVDRTPLHDRYVSKRLDDELKKCIRLLKKFMKSNNVYGAELKVKGFSGYLTELLVLEYGKKGQSGIESFKDVLRASGNWKKGQVIDLEDHGVKQKFDAPLIVIDPIDPNRNVAAALEMEQWAKFIGASMAYLENSKKSFFVENREKEYSSEELVKTIEERKTRLIGLEFNLPDLVDDTLYPQLYKTENWLKKLLRQEEFDLIRSGVYRDNEKALVLFEVWNDLPRVEKHIGPPVTSKKHSKSFIEKYKNQEVFCGPYIEKDRWVVERKREYVHPENLIEQKTEDIKQSGIGKNLKRVDKKVLSGPSLLKEKYLSFIGDFLTKKAVWLD